MQCDPGVERTDLNAVIDAMESSPTGGGFGFRAVLFKGQPLFRFHCGSFQRSPALRGWPIEGGASALRPRVS